MPGPLSESLAEACRIGETDSFGNLINQQVRIFQEFGRDGPAHIVEHRLIRQPALRQPAMQCAQGKAQLWGDFVSRRKALGAVQACHAYLPNEIGFSRLFGHYQVAELLADLVR